MARSAPKERALPGVEGKTNIGTSNVMGKMADHLEIGFSSERRNLDQHSTRSTSG